MSRQTIVVTSAFTFSLLALLGSPAAAQDDPVAQLRTELEQQQAEMARLKQMVANMAGSGSAVGAGTIAVIDLNTVMKALGRDREVQFQLQTEQKLISEELKDRQSKIRTHLETESQKVAASEASDQEKKKKMELLQRKLQQIWQQEMQKARKDINDYRGSLNKAFLAQLLPFAKSSAQELGASVVAARTVASALAWCEAWCDVRFTAFLRELLLALHGAGATARSESAAASRTTFSTKCSSKPPDWSSVLAISSVRAMIARFAVMRRASG